MLQKLLLSEIISILYLPGLIPYDLTGHKFVSDLSCNLVHLENKYKPFLVPERQYRDSVEEELFPG